ncbi:hypothetical protein EIP86_001554 [Pleurotus ostreatoroseus]|nr:hypothetical protein EIP86_001554 [Pleurotus ostreatoroseus]
MTAKPSTVLADFVSQQKTQYLTAVRDGSAKEWVVAMGNEAGDLDSMASAIAWAWYASTVQKTPTVPLIQTPHADLHLRAENLHALSLAGFNSTKPDLLCIDDLSPPPLPSHRFALVDHNRLHPTFASADPEAHVVAVLDHHADEGCHLDAAPRIVVVPTGSAASLVANALRDGCAAAGVDLPRELATLLLCAILVDTGGLKEGGKAEAADHEAAAFLVPISLLNKDEGGTNFSATALHEAHDVQELTQTLQAKKADVSHLNTRDLLRRDYKEYSLVPSWASDKPILVGLSTVPMGLKSWVPRDAAFWTSTEEWMKDRGLAVLGILTSFRDEEKMNKHGKGKHRREQLFVVREGELEGLAEKIFQGLKSNEELDLKKINLTEDYGVQGDVGFAPEYKWKVWKQGNVEATRKITAPVVKAIVEGEP